MNRRKVNVRGPPSSAWRGEACDDGKQGSPGRAPLTCTFGTPQARQSKNAKTCPTLHPSPKIPANLRARVQQPSPTSRPNLPRVLRWNPDANANARHTGGGEYTDFDKLLSPTDDALPGQAVAPKKSRKTKRQVCDLQS